jgi:hypothetical protein
MTAFLYTEGAYQLRNGGSVNFLSDTIQMVLVKSTYTPGKHDTNTILAANEISGVTGYVGGFAGSGRATLASKTITKNNTLDAIVYDADDPAAWTIGVGETIGGAVLIKKGSADDTTAVLLCYLGLATPIVTNGSDVELAFDADGIFDNPC